VLTLNNISSVGLERLPGDMYEVSTETAVPDAILVRSHKMHDMDLPGSVLCIGRAGAGVNNIPVEAMTQRGIPVFNAPGANANAVKELVVAGMLLASRNICQAWSYTRALQGDDATLNKHVEQGKKTYAGFELSGRTLGIVGLGAIGRLVANAALALGMRVIGYDPGITVQGAWRLSADVRQASSIEDLLGQVDFVTFHVPLVDATRHMINAERVNVMRPGTVVLNFARAGIVDDSIVPDAIGAGKIGTYVCDFPSANLLNHDRVISLPHLGASTAEAEDNCAMMVVDQMRDYIENGNINNSVNFPQVSMPRMKRCRLPVTNLNVPNMVGQITTKLASANINIVDMMNKSSGEVAYTIVDVDTPICAELFADIKQIEGVLSVRVIC